VLSYKYIPIAHIFIINHQKHKNVEENKSRKLNLICYI